MTALKIEAFGGMMPAWGDQLLPENQAAFSLDAYLFSGNLQGWRKPKLLRALTNTSARFVYRVPKITGTNQLADTSITATDSIWLEFLDRETDVMRSPVVDDNFGRYYFASPSVVPKYNTYDRIVAGSSAWLLGVPAPTVKPTVTVAGGGDDILLGYPNSVRAEIDHPGANKIILTKITPAETTLCTSGSIKPAQTNATAQFGSVLYSNSSANTPLTLLNAGTVVQGCTANTTLTSSFINPTTLVAGTSYWIGMMFDTDVGMHRANNNAKGAIKTNTFSNGPPASGSGTTQNRPTWQLWATCVTPAVLAARAYAYTWVTAYSEEGPPSPPTLLTGWSNGTWTIGMTQPAAADKGVNRNITKTRLYRTISDQTGLTTYFFVAEFPVAQASYVDRVQDDTISLNNQLPSSDWFSPPTDLQGIKSLPNGMAVGWRANELWFCEPYRPHAWPPRYVISTEFPIVGVGSNSSSVVICTKGKPYIAQGTNPESMSLTKPDLPEPCISKGSIVASDDGVLYASPNGLIQVAPSGQTKNITEMWITRERWRELTPSKFLHAIKLSSSYFAFGVVVGTDTSVAQDGFTIEIADTDNPRIGFTKLSAPNDFNIVNVQVDPWTGAGLLLQNGQVYYYDFSDQEPTLMSYTWKSKAFHQNVKTNFGAMKVFFSVPENTPTLSATRNEAETDDASWDALGANQYGFVRVYADDELVTVREFRTSGELLRILAGYKAETWQFEILSRVRITDLQVATSVKELARV